MRRLQHKRRARESAALLFALLLALASPAGAATPGPQRTRSFQIRVGQTVSLRAYGLSVRLVSVAEDSRCPEGVQCVWAGNVRLALRLSGSGFGSRRVSLNTATRPTEVNFRGRTLRVVEVTPPKREGRDMGQRDYRVTLEVAR